MPMVKVNGVSCYYEESGWGRPLILVHGFACGVRMWDPQVKALASRYRVITYDVRGHGASEMPEADDAYSQMICVEDLKGLLLHFGISRAVVGGLSMGGNIALNFGISYPDMIDGLIICDTGSGSDDPAWATGCERWAQLLDHDGIEAFADAHLTSPYWAHYVAQGSEAARLARSLITTHRARGLVGTIRGVLACRPTIYSLEPKLRQLQVPVLLVVGEYDEPCIKTHQFMADVIPRSEHIVIKGFGHLISLEDPTTFNAVVERFLLRVCCA